MGENQHDIAREIILHISLKFQHLLSSYFQFPASVDNPVDEHQIRVKCAHIKSQSTYLPKL